MEHLGWTPAVTVQEGLKETIEHFNALLSEPGRLSAEFALA